MKHPKPEKFQTDPETYSLLAKHGTIRLMRAVEKYGLSRTLLFHLCVTNQIKSYLVKRHPNSRGTRLIEVASLLDYIKKQGASK